MNKLTEQDLRDIEAGAMLTQRQDKLMASELLSLREQLAELKAWATNRAITDDARENENYTTLKIDYRQRQLRELLKAAKPSED